MRLQALEVDGVTLIHIDPVTDERGFFARLFCYREFAELGLMPRIAQESVSRNARAGTLRGFHLQTSPHQEAKLITCVRGSVYDVALDARPGSPTYGRWSAVTLTSGEWTALYIPEGCAHAHQALEDGSELLYRMSTEYAPEFAAGYRWNSPGLEVPWPIPQPILSERDKMLPEFQR